MSLGATAHPLDVDPIGVCTAAVGALGPVGSEMGLEVTAGSEIAKPQYPFDDAILIRFR